MITKPKAIAKNRFRIACLALIAFLSALRPLTAHDPQKCLTQYIQRLWQLEEGLPQMSVTCALAGREGFLWLGTQEGLARFDGFRFRVFNEKNTPEMKSHHILSLAQGPDGTLWIGTETGCLALVKGRFYPVGSDLKPGGLIVNAVAAAKDGSLWIGSSTGLICLKNGRPIRFPDFDLLSRTVINSLTGSHSGGVWIGTHGRGLFSINGEVVKEYSTRNGLSSDLVSKILETADGKIWVGTLGGGLNRIDARGISGYREGPGGLSNDTILSLYEDRYGSLWIGTNGGGLNRLYQGRFAVFDSRDGLSNDSVTALCETPDEMLWVGTSAGGLNGLHDGDFTLWSKREGLPVDIVRAILVDRSGRMWIGTGGGGLSWCENGRIQTIDHAGNSGKNYVRALYNDRENRLWAGISGTGLDCLVGGRSQPYPGWEMFREQTVRAITESTDGTLWVGSAGSGLFYQRSGKWRSLTAETGLPQGLIRTLCPAADGGLWIGGEGGLQYWRAGKVESHLADGEANPIVTALYEDQGGDLWIGTSGHGLGRLKKGMGRSIEFCTEKNGLHDNAVFAIIEDNHRRLWMSCNSGIFLIEKDSFERFSATGAPVCCQVYGTSDGLRSPECNSGYPCGWAERVANGGVRRLYFATMKGVAEIDPDREKMAAPPPSMYIEAVQTNLRTRTYDPDSPSLHLGPGETTLTISYAACAFAYPDETRYRYRLQGWETDWNEVGASDRSARYTNIPPGRYTFELTAANHDGIWSARKAFLHLWISPRYWQTWWFRIFVLTGFAFLSYFLIAFFRNHVRLVAFWKKRQYIGPYRIIRSLGSGGMATVFLCHPLFEPKRLVAVKVLREEFMLDPIRQKRFRQEGAIIDQLDHPHIVRVIERGVHDGLFFIAMEYVPGLTLAQYTLEKGALDIDRWLEILEQLADVLVKIHAHGIIHRDLKPANIMVMETEAGGFTVKLLDFGIARLEHQTTVTEWGSLLGTLQYVAPEQISRSEYTPAGDIYSLGLIGYEMITGMNPFAKETSLALIQALINRPPRPPCELRLDIPPPLNQLIQEMIDHDPQLRPDALTLLAQLKKMRGIAS